MSGKGDKRRPMNITQKEYECNYISIFGESKCYKHNNTGIKRIENTTQDAKEQN